MAYRGNRHNSYYGSKAPQIASINDDDINLSEDHQIILNDESKFARLIKKLLRDDGSIDSRAQRLQEFQNYLDKPDNTKFILKLARPALNLLYHQFQDRLNEDLRPELARCIGLIGFVMMNEGDPKFADWIFERLNEVKKNDTFRQYLVGSLHISIGNEEQIHCLSKDIQKISGMLKKILESVSSAPLMIIITETIIDLAKIYPLTFQTIFVDIVDILIGWYIEPYPTDRILDFTSKALNKFRLFWLEQIESTTLPLLNNFIDDADSYAQLCSTSTLTRYNEENFATLTDKIAALYRAFVTVLRSLSDDFTSSNLLPDHLVTNWLKKILHTTSIVINDIRFGSVAVYANASVRILIETFSQLDDTMHKDLIDFVTQQTLLSSKDWPIEADSNLIRLITKIIDFTREHVPISFANSILHRNSRLWIYRFLHATSLIQDALQLFNRLLSMKNIPVVLQVYQSILADITQNFNVILPTLKQKTINIGGGSGGSSSTDETMIDVTEDNAEAAIIFDCSALCQIGNAKGNLIGMYALSPSLFELLSRHLQLTNSKLARQFPASHFAVLKTLYSHCVAHEHFILSSDLFNSNSTSDRMMMSLSSSTKDHLEDILKLHHRLIVNSHTSCHDTNKLVLNWLAEIIDSLPQDDRGLFSLPLLLKICHSIVDTAYSDEEEICALCCRLLTKILRRHSDLEATLLVRLFDLCRFWLQCNEPSIRDNYFAILCCLPVNINVSKFPISGAIISKNDYSGFASIVKRNHMATSYSGTFTVHCFNLTIGYILIGHQMPRMYANTWLDRLFQSCQRKWTDTTKYKQHQRALAYEQIPNFGNDALLWFWAIWECAQYCVMNKLKTSLGKPQETFLALEETLRAFAWPVTKTDTLSSSSDHVPSTSSNSNEANIEKPEWWCDLHRCGLLLQLIECLEKCIYNAYEGTALSLPQLPKPIKFFFMTNKSTCFEWLNRIRIPIILTAVRSGQYEAAVRNCWQYITHICTLGQAETSEFEFVVISFVQSLIKLHNSMALNGIYVWLKNTHQLRWQWIKAAEYEAAGSLEKAANEYRRLLKEHFENLSKSSSENSTGEKTNDTTTTTTTISSALLKFLTQKVYECYISLHQWSEVMLWNETCIKMQNGLLQDENEDLKTAMETNIDMNAVKAMGCFENRDFEGMKMAMRKLPFVQSSADELARSVPCGWDMDAYDMLAPIETLKAIAKRRSGLWSLNTLLQLTQELTRVHTVDEHASWSDERAAIGQIAALYQSEHRDLPFLSSSKFAPIQHSVKALNSILLYSQPYFGNPASSSANTNWSELRLSAARLARQQDNFTLSSKLLIQQFLSDQQSSANYSFDNYSLHTIVNLLERQPNVATIELETETAKLMYSMAVNKITNNTNNNNNNNLNITSAIEFLSRCILRYMTSEKQRSSTCLEKCSRNLLHIVKWLRSSNDVNNSNTTSYIQNSTTTGKLFHLRKQYLLTGFGTDIASEPYVRSNIPSDQLLMGELLDFSTTMCPSLAKSWFSFADFCYTWGKQLLTSQTQLSQVEIRQKIQKVLPQELPTEEVNEIYRIITSSSVNEDDDLETTTDEQTLLESQRTSLSKACSLLTKRKDLLDKIISFHPFYDKRRYFLLDQACRSYFTYLKLSNYTDDANSTTIKPIRIVYDDDASNVLVTLRLLRVLVRYPQQMKETFENGLKNMPTVSWKRIIPQLFSRLNHADSIVRDCVTNLLCRIAKDFPQLLLYPVVVGTTDGGRSKTTTKTMFGPATSTLTSRGGDDGGSDDDNSDNVTDENIQEGEGTLAMDNSFRLLFDILSETNSHVVSQVKLFVYELRRITVLWEELWLGTLTQLQEEIGRRVDNLKDELQRLETMSHLTKDEKEFIIKEKQDVVFKSFLTVLETINQITKSTTETPREEFFQNEYCKQIDGAIEQMKQPISLTNPHGCWLGFRQLYTLLHRSGKRSAVVYSMNQISPKLSNIKNSVIPIPGDDGQFYTIMSVGQTVQVLPTKTRPKKLMFVGSNGRRYQYLLKGLEDLHLDERIMQLLSTINVMFTKMNRTEPWTYEARNYAVIPLASRSGLIQWVEGAIPLFTLYKRWQQRQAMAQTMKAQSENHDPNINPVQKPNDVYYNKLNALLKEKGKQAVDDRREVALPVIRQCLEELIRETPGDLLSSRSLAVTSMIGYIIGLGDRHLDNVLVDLKTGQIIHIDYNVCFEKGKKLRVPEKVPYRMTQNLQHALGIAGLEGVFFVSSENVLRILRLGKETLLNLLEAFVYDPLIDWTGHDTSIIAAFYGGERNLLDQITMKKRLVEKDVLIRMFRIRSLEIRQSWANLG
ncbi:unnamed protein product [Didymodactylos carnosus]|uniref:non-specific serine/threonine protein kinase n=2 Tax=Didymodactylos carnosus TaxID=1234261 RepID=A0A814UBE1_9BILA|nr:unnamed protein product [Didymodactylos carnosus]CAF3938258.1 unnamed protein product [Didymodactylos carnosus]